ncbi:MAG: tRNA (5-methylaminomethyl-2-thiouridine)(34)-methyltransferase MnmD [Bacteroidales bacterium]|nr:tRNA (5-methylaminomethyl-2-thiouridine)(34)-methyltransferase MnmD [Bacteroidales bacterium]
MIHILQQTLDGSHTIYIPEMDEHYHSTNGAIQEALHIYIAKAYNHSKIANPVVFEVGFGTGLNTFLTAIEAEKNKRPTTYVSIEKYPLEKEEYSLLNYSNMAQQKDLFEKIHEAEWDRTVKISEFFYLKKIYGDLTTFPEIPSADVIYFDAFAPNKQSSMWSTEIFTYLFNHTNSDGILTTYCAKGDVRRMMQAVGYSVERTDGPPGKREMLRAVRL